MRWPALRFRFGLRTLLLLVLVSAVAIWLWITPGRWRTYRNIEARKRIDPYELSVAQSDCPDGLPPELVAILGDSRLKHWHWIRNVELLPGDLLASHSFDGVRVWDLKTARQQYFLPAKAVAISRDGKRLFIADPKGNVRIVDPATGKSVGDWEIAKADQLVALATNQDGSRLLAEVRLDQNASQLRVWDVAAKSVLWSTDVAGSWQEIAMNGAGTKVAWSANRKLYIDDVDSAAEPMTFLGLDTEVGPTGIDNVAFSHDDAAVLARTGLWTIMAYDVNTGESTPWIEVDQGSSIDGFALSSNGRYLVMRLSNRFYSYSRRNSGKWDERIEVACMQGHVNDVSLQKRILVAGHADHSISLWDNHKPGRPWRLPGGSLRPDVASLAFHPDGKRLITGSRDGQIVVWSTRDWREINRWKAHVEQIPFLACSNDGRWIASSSDDSRVVVWDATDYAEIASIGNFQLATPLSMTRDGTYLATNSDGPDNPGLYELPAGTAVPAGKSGKRPWRSGMVAISPSGNRVVVAQGKGNVQLFDAATFKSLGTFNGEKASSFWGRIVWSPDGSLVAMHDNNDTATRIWDPSARKLVHTLDAGTGNLDAVAFDGTGEWLAMCGTYMPVQLWHVPSGKLIKTWQIGPVTGKVSQVHFSPDGHYLATVNGNGTAYILSLDGVLAP